MITTNITKENSKGTNCVSGDRDKRKNNNSFGLQILRNKGNYLNTILKLKNEIKLNMNNKNHITNKDNYMINSLRKNKNDISIQEDIENLLQIGNDSSFNMSDSVAI